MSLLSFSEQRRLLDEQLSDPKLFDGAIFNYYKVAQHGFTYANNQDSSKLLETHFDLTAWKFRLFKKAKHLKSGRIKIPALNRIVAIDGGRTSVGKDGETRLTYFHHLLNCVESDGYSVINFSKNQDVPADFSLIDVWPMIAAPPCSPSVVDLFKDLKSVLQRMESAARFSKEQISYVASAFHNFLEEYSWALHMLARGSAETVLFYPHYHREGLIAACKTLGLNCFEIQHGLIAENDLYYCFPEAIQTYSRKALFPDKLLVFGEYWKQVVLRGHEHSADSVQVIGDYQFQEQTQQVAKENIVFIGAQKNMAASYVQYTTDLLERIQSNYPDWKVVLKMHPLEKEVSLYQQINHPQFELVGNNANLADLLAKSKIQISIYSTTFFDALPFNVLNFSLQDFTEFADYARDMIAEKVALPLKTDEDPIQIFEAHASREIDTLNSIDVYGTFDRSAFKTLINH